MSIKDKLGRAGGIAAAAVVIGVGGVGLAGSASAATVGNPTNGRSTAIRGKGPLTPAECGPG